jgi:aryl-alcohol dehydrogenase-like predicted oxidoreductase
MDSDSAIGDRSQPVSRRGFLRQVGQAAVAGGAAAWIGGASGAEAPMQVKYRTLGRTGLKVSEVGIGGHTWIYHKQLRDKAAEELLAAAMEHGINYIDGCLDDPENTVPGEALKRMGKRDKFVICVRWFGHGDRDVYGKAGEEDAAVTAFVEKRLKHWQTDYLDIAMASDRRNGNWDWSVTLAAFEKMKKAGKIRFCGFGTHFDPAKYKTLIAQFGKSFDICSMPYNVRHRAAEEVLPAADEAGLGIITIKPFARGSLLKNKSLQGADAGLPRDMIAFVLENKHVDVVISSMPSVACLKENVSGSWTPLTPEGRKRLEVAAANECPPGERDWLDRDWRYV